MKRMEILFNSPMMKEQVRFESVSDMVTFLNSQMSVVPSYYVGKLTVDCFRINVLPSNMPNVFSMSIPVDSDYKKTLDNVISWMRAIDKMNY